MTRAIIAALCLCPLLAACETSTATGSTSIASVTAANAPDEDVYLCEEDATTGTHMRTKECRSRAQRKEEKRSAEQFLHKPQQGPGQQ